MNLIYLFHFIRQIDSFIHILSLSLILFMGHKLSSTLSMAHIQSFIRFLPLICLQN
jgi:hypothetical protein